MPNNKQSGEEKEQSSNKINIWRAFFVASIVVGLLVLIALLCYFFLDREWRGRTLTYENSRFSYSIDYPIGWVLGEAPTNNDGRDIVSENEEAMCSIFGFNNSLTSDSGGPQTLEEHVDWILSNEEIDLIERKDTKVDDADATYLHYNSMDSVVMAVYTLNQEEGLGFFCSYSSSDLAKKYKTTFEEMSESINLNIDESVDFGGDNCDTLLSGVSIPLIDMDTIVDASYTGVTMIDRDSWDREKLPAKVIENENNGYVCYPTPLEFNSEESGGDELSQPEVTKVEWLCELEYEDFKYINSDDPEKDLLISSGYGCESVSCEKDGLDDSVLLCTK